LRIRVAGCGTVQAAYTAFIARDDEVVGVDLSEASLAHERYLQERHGLANLKLYQGDLLEIGDIGGRFDVILCSGVLHHMADPALGLAALRDVLAPDGAMMLMVYGKTQRAGVYMLQEAFRHIGIGQDPAGVAQVRALLAELPQAHFAQSYIRASAELRHDTALVDTFLHPQDRAYTVSEIFEWLEGAGLAFQNWVDNHTYYRNSRWRAGSAVAKAVDPLPERDHWIAVEMLSGTQGMHIFTARHPAPNGSFAVDFADPAWLNFVPHRAPGLGKTGKGRFQRGGYTLRCAVGEEFLFDGIDGKRSIAEILSHPALAATPKEKIERFARAFFEEVWKLGHIMVALPAE
jgi:SAM-dependent methyltransferase